MTAARWQAMAERMLAGQGASTVQWTRRALTSDGPAGTVTVDSSTTHDVRAAQVSEQQVSRFSDQSWLTAQVRIVIPASSLPFAAEAHSGFPEVRFDDTVLWLGVPMRVVFLRAWTAPGGPGAPPEPVVYFVGLGA
jgi:hypothetical protein